MKIIFVTPHFFPSIGGVERVVLFQATELFRRGFDVEVLTSFSRWPFGTVNAPKNDTVCGIPTRRLHGLFSPRVGQRAVFPVASNLLAITGLYSALNQSKPDVIHVHHLVPNVVRNVVDYRKRHPSVRVFWQPHFHPRQKALLEMLRGYPDRYAYKTAAQCGTFITINPVEADQIQCQYLVKPAYFFIPNGFAAPLGKLKSKSSECPRLLSVGRVDDVRKGHRFLLKALARLQTRSWELTLVGRGDQNSLRYYSQRLGIGERIRFTGEVSDECLRKWYEVSDIFIMPSEYEAFGLPLLEAMSAGIPVVATGVGGIPFVVGEAGVIVQYGDTEALSSELANLMEDPDRRHRLALRGQARMERFSPKAITEDLIAAYRD